MRQYPARRRAALALLLALALSLLAACGGAPAAAPTSGVNQGLGNSPTAAAAARESADPAAPAATQAPAAEMSAADLEAAVPLAGAEGAPNPSGDGASSDTTSAAGPRPLGQEASLKAGEINDNERFGEYLDYLSSYQGGGVRPVDVSERYLIRVLDDSQRPFLDARVTIYADDQVVFQGRTYASGETIFLPRALGVSPNATRFRAVAEYGSASAETSFERSPGGKIEIGLRGVQRDDTLRLDLLFLLDTTGSMGDELGRIQQTIDSIAQRIDGFTPRPQIRYGLVAYKDHGDDYVTSPADFTTDLGQFRAALNQLTAKGGGDTPEAVDEAMYDTVMRSSWSDQPAVRLVFLVADAGPHTDGQQQFTYLDGAREAAARGVKIYPIAASNTDAPAEYVFRQLAQQTMGGFVFLTYQPGQNSGAPGESTTLEAGDQPYSVERLDDLIVSIVERELAAAVGAR
ncbi:VWA domain-containing protein [Chloroflexales bacterium ZM16-3]|nr:VWA domain-containing protein [Chloroflexales bacterium ZM16-3]